MTTRTPAAGEPLYLDGFAYILGGSKQALDDQGQPMIHRFFARPEAADAAIEAAHKASVNYKLSGAVADERELVWVTRVEYLALARAQADALVRGGTTPAARLWGGAAFEAIADVVPSWPEGFWTLPGRALVDPPCRLEDREPRMIVPTSAAHALELARATLDHSFYAADAVEG